MSTFPSHYPPEPIRNQPRDPDAYESNTLFDWSDDLPRPARSYTGRDYNAMQPATMTALIAAAMALPYRGVWKGDIQQWVIEDERFHGLTMGEVIAFKTVEAAALGGQKERDAALDRFMGKPKQQIEQSISSMSYTEFLEQSAREEQQARQHEQMTRQGYIDVPLSNDHLDDILGDI